MATKKSVAKLDLLELKLTAAERKLIVEKSRDIPAEIVERVAAVSGKQPVLFDEEELEDSLEWIAGEINHAVDEGNDRLAGKFDRVMNKIEDVLNEITSDAMSLFEGGSFADALDDANPLDAMMNSVFGMPMLGGGLGGSAARPQKPPAVRVTFTAAQRHLLVGMNTISDDIRQMLDTDQKGSKVFDLNPRQALIISLAAFEATQTTAQRANVKDLEAIVASIVNAVPDLGGLGSGEAPRLSDTSSLTTSYQLKITLQDSKPPIWRRVRVADCALGNLHSVIQIAMGWQDCHPHSFEVEGIDYGDVENVPGGDEMENEWNVLLSSLVAGGVKKFKYWYDFGDNWWHTIQIESTHRRTPDEPLARCIKGKGACPPEDCGGIWGYYELLAILQDPKHEQHDEMLEWLGEMHDPAEFDAAEVNRSFACMVAVDAE